MGKIKKILIAKNGKKFYVKDTTVDYHCQFGFVKAADLKKKKVVTNTGQELYCINAQFKDLYARMKRAAQIIPLKDVGAILAEAGITNKSVVVDAGAGSGALAIFLAMHAKKVYTYDIREDHIKIVKHNKELFGVKNLEINKHDIYTGVPIKNVDVITLDVPEPWLVLEHAQKALKQGGVLISYSPCIPQVQDFVNAVRENEKFTHIKTIEITERQWEVEGRKVRPKTQGLGHSGFLSIVRKLV